MDDSTSTPPIFKRCTKCNQEFPATVEYFKAEKHGKYGVTSQCRTCLYQRDWDYNHRPEIVERRRIKEQTSEYKVRSKASRQRPEAKERERQREQTPERKEYILHYHKSASYKASRKRYRQTDKGRHTERQYNNRVGKDKKRLYELSPRGKETKRANYHRRRVREIGLPNTMTPTHWLQALDYWNHKCAICGCEADFWTTIAADHWTPLSKNGGTTPENILPLCHSRKGVPNGKASCNQSKGNKDPAEWLISKLGKRNAKKKLAEIETYFEWVRQQDNQ